MNAAPALVPATGDCNWIQQGRTLPVGIGGEFRAGTLGTLGTAKLVLIKS